MNREELMMRTIDLLGLHSKALSILQRKDIPYVQAEAMITEMFRHYELESEDYYEKDYGDEPVETKSDEQELIDDDNRERAADMNAVNRSYY